MTITSDMLHYFENVIHVGFNLKSRQSWRGDTPSVRRTDDSKPGRQNLLDLSTTIITFGELKLAIRALVGIRVLPVTCNSRVKFAHECADCMTPVCIIDTPSIT